MWKLLLPSKKLRPLLLCFLLSTLLVACGTGNSIGSTQQISTPTGVPPARPTATSQELLPPTPSSTQPQVEPTAKSVADLLVPNKNNLAVDTNGLHIQEDGGFHCTSQTGAFSDNFYVNLMLASDRLTYDQGELQQMKQYYDSAVKAGKSLDFSQVPSTLRWAEGALASQKFNITGSCSVSLQITNTGSAAIQISRIALSVKAKPVPNTFTYPLIDECPIFLQVGLYGCNGGHGGGPTRCTSYDVGLFLGNAQLNDEIGDTPSAGIDRYTNKPCPQLTLTPQQSKQLMLFVSGQAYIYAVHPRLTMITAQGSKLVELPSLDATLAFANSFPTCYKLEGNTFVEESKAKHVASNDASCI